MRRANLAVIVVLLISLTFGAAILPVRVGAMTLYVGGAGPGNYTTIQVAIDDANPGDTVFVFNGTYLENIIVNKTISLQGEGSNTTIIDGNAAGDVVYVYSDWVNISGFTVRNGGPSTFKVGMKLWYSRDCRIASNVFTSNVGDGLRVEASPNAMIVGNTAFSNLNGFSISTSGNNPIVANNTAFNNQEHGFILDSAFVEFVNNSATGNGEYGILLDSARYNLVAYNTASDNRYGIVHTGSVDNLIMNNTVTFNTEAGVFGGSFTNLNGNNLSSNGQYGILLLGSQWSHIVNNTIQDNEQGIYFDRAENNTVSHNNISSNNWTGVQLWESPNNRFTDNVVSSNRWYGLTLGSSQGSIITNNSVSRNELLGINLGYSGNAEVTGNYISDTGVAVSVGSSSNVTVSDNTMVGSGIWISGFRLEWWNTHTIDTLNTVNGKPVHYWKDTVGGIIPPGAGEVILANCSDAVVANQNLSGGSMAVELGFSSNNTIASNTASDSRAGILLFESVDNSIENNSFLSNELWGIWLEDSDANAISDNSVSNAQWGITLFFSFNSIISRNDVRRNDCGICLDSADGTIVHNNTVLRNGYGILVDSTSVIVSGNTVSTSDYGIYVSSPDTSTIYHNNIIGNTNQAYDFMSNQWDNGYPSGGNFWSDYTGIDNCSGPSQDICPDPDGIGDTPYVIDADSQDRYPLMSPSTVVPPRPPKVVRAILTGTSAQNVTLEWSLSLDDGIGLKSVIGYEIHRGTSFDRGGIGYQTVAVLPNGTSSFVDINAGEGDPDCYFYRVCAVDSNNFIECGEIQAAKFTRPLAQGPNLVSIPLIQSYESIEIVLQTVEYDKAWNHDSSSHEWKWYMTSKTYRRGLWNMDQTTGIWVNVTEDSNLTVAGIVPAETLIHLTAGWNLVSFPSFNSSYAAYDLRMETGAVRVEGYDSSPPYHLRVFGDVEVLQAGYGYWVKVETAVDWIVEMS